MNRLEVETNSKHFLHLHLILGILVFNDLVVSFGKWIYLEFAFH